MMRGSRLLGCTRCRLATGRTQVVWLDGNPDSDLMFIGEAPGFNEDKLGKPFVGAAGKLLDQLLDHIGLDRGGCVICNVIKCRPPANRNPEPDEIATCSPYLRAQIELHQADGDRDPRQLRDPLHPGPPALDYPGPRPDLQSIRSQGNSYLPPGGGSALGGCRISPICLDPLRLQTDHSGAGQGQARPPGPVPVVGPRAPMPPGSRDAGPARVALSKLATSRRAEKADSQESIRRGDPEAWGSCWRRCWSRGTCW